MKQEDLEIRYTTEEDAPYLQQWLLEPGVLKGFPAHTEKEVEETVKHWIGFSKWKSSLTAVYKGEPCGIVTLCLMPYTKIAHHSLVAIIIAGHLRNQGIGTILLNNIIHLAKEYFRLEYLYLEVYEGNPAIRLYHRFGFKTVGEQPHFMKEDGQYVSKIIMERKL